MNIQKELEQILERFRSPYRSDSLIESEARLVEATSQLLQTIRKHDEFVIGENEPTIPASELNDILSLSRERTKHGRNILKMEQRQRSKQSLEEMKRGME